MKVLPVLLRLGGLALLLAFLVAPVAFEPVFAPLTEFGQPAIYSQDNLLSLALAHLSTVCTAVIVSTIFAVSLGIFVTRPFGREFMPLSRSIANIGQTFPPVAVLAMAVPAVGFGEAPTLIALFLYGLLPILENTISGLLQVPAPVLDAARGVGMSERQSLWQVELPLATPVILEGVRVSAVINLGTATIGSTVAAKGLGEVIVAGLLSSNTAYILQGGMVVGLMAVLLYDGLQILERRASRVLGTAFSTGDHS
ncbi:ABC transporter permease [Microvirga sp. M2]|uniref:ABC transporter permease n=1 Tax=Microvirga sp. M2 TaxID=3073270 RepID=UPI0039C1DFB3